MAALRGLLWGWQSWPGWWASPNQSKQKARNSKATWAWTRNRHARGETESMTNNQHPDFPTGPTALEQDAIGVFEVTQALIAAGFTEEQAFKYIAIRSAVVVNCASCGAAPNEQ
ncbi:hypothetical protein ArV1_062 [Arthrobacter phage vB_ArtM-ArV1]|uniref:Uncharacterized protein n=1 Tax=Arthrobacter phage vB_ArtM-ArV1 TaxID=1566993 RepID=A0A0A7HE75_9CAUD|nr:hypothetical protein ArV1_062 [Arthrobacter phage vB_ArtM-ArV1]AIZ01750.1 hypothetical protein ArV1_062 [Arthrobacter phage vB_ArtM-ArV1]